MKLKSPTDETLHVALLSGHAIAIGPEGRDVPRLFLQAAFIAGAVHCGAQEETAATANGRMESIKQGIREMLEQGAELTGAGLPNRKALSAAVGFAVESAELGDAWSELVAEAATS
jgi:hypothetical protein